MCPLEFPALFLNFYPIAKAEKESGAVGVAAEAAQLCCLCLKRSSFTTQNKTLLRFWSQKMSSFNLEESSKILDEKIRLNAKLISEISGSAL